VDLLGVLDETESRAWAAMKRRGRASARQLAADLDEPEAVVRSALDRLWERRLIARRDEQYVPISELS
jgi:predicted ArsR family transcriptional regulator